MGRVRPVTNGVYCVRMAERQRVDSESDDMPSTLRMASSNPTDSDARYNRGTVSSPQVPPMYAQSASPYRYGKYLLPFVNCLIVGRSLRSTASRSHMAVCASSPPNDRYSAIPSTSQ